jgi:hypothetical protein
VSATALPEIGEPFARDEIALELDTLHRASTAFWDAIPDDEFFARIGDAWSPAENVRHLDKSLRPVAQALRVPKLLLRWKFGRPAAPSRTLAAIRDAYRARLAAGQQAGRFAPSPRPAPAGASERVERRRELMARREATHRALVGAIARWNETALDRHQLPHPALGPITVREMLLFSLLHNQHHVANVARRRAHPPA